ncbi:MAG: tail fiber protein [Pseudohongiella sp.]|uniref:phage tail protein n=1 Tax=Pseudohongiella sp. TaxID=1979412 RepID=UPI0034A052DE
MAEPYLGEIRVFSFNTIPKGWMRCEGQLLQTNQNQALFSLLGDVYGGNGSTTFALPDLRGRVPMHVSPAHKQGEAGGEATHTLTINELPPHSHAVAASSAVGTVTTPEGNVWANSGDNPMYAERPDTKMQADALAHNGGGQPHENMQPWQVLSLCISVEGIYPSRN